MKALITILALILGLPISVEAQQPSQNKIRYPSESEIRSNRIADVEREVAEYSKTKSPYIKFDDGKVVYLGKLLYERHGLLNHPDSIGIGGVMLIAEEYTVVHSLTNNCHIRFRDSITRRGDVERREMFVENLWGMTNQVSKDYLIVQSLGDYKCKPAPGESHTISRCTLGKEATKQDYLDYVANTKKKP